MTEVKETLKVDLPAEKVWALIGGFNDLGKWHPAIAGSEYDPARKTRTLTATDGVQFVEELVASSDRSYTYRILSSPLPVTRYTSTLSVTALGQDSSEVTWKSEFDPDGASEAEARQIISGIYTAGLDNIGTLAG